MSTVADVDADIARLRAWDADPAVGGAEGARAEDEAFERGDR